MSEWLSIFLLAVIQGLTEFLPISSSGHLALLPWLTGLQDQGLSLDVAVHVGTLIAVVGYFRGEVVLLISHSIKSLFGGPQTLYSRLAWAIGLATIFVGLAGMMFDDFIGDVLRNPIPIAVATIVFGIVLGWADKTGKQMRNIDSIGWSDAVVIGIAQAIALIPGTSRSGITIAAGLAVGLTRDAAARFSFLLSIPVILLAGAWQGFNWIETTGHDGINWQQMLFAIGVSAFFAWVCIHYFLRFIDRVGLMPFVIYRLVLGVILLIVFV